MGIAATFSLLRTLPPDRRREFAEAALREPYGDLQRAAFEALADPADLDRPDLVVLHYPELLPEVRARVLERRDLFVAAASREARSPHGRCRRSAYLLLGDLAAFEAVPLLAEGIIDASGPVREAAVGALGRLAVLYREHLANVRAPGGERSRELVGRYGEAMLRAARALLRIYPGQEHRAILDVLLESGGDAFETVCAAIPPQPDAPLHRVFRDALAEAPGEPVVELLFRLAWDAGSPLKEMAREVMGRRRDAAFGRAVGAWMARLPPERRASLAGGMTEAPWWPAVEAAGDLDPAAAGALLELLSRSALDPARRDGMILHFLKSPHPEVRARGLEVLQALRSPALEEAARRALEDPSEAVQIAAARAVASLERPGKARLLGGLLQSPSEEVRRIAVREISREGFARYLAAFDRLSPATREAAARALAKIDGAMLDRLAGEIQSLDPQRRLKALQVVGYVDAARDLRDLLMDLISDPDRRVRATAVKIVELSGHVEGMRLLIGALSDPDERVRANAIEAFEEIGDPRYAQFLTPFLDDPDNRVRANAAKALWVLGRREVRETLEAMLADPREEMRLSAAWAIGEMRYEGFVRALEERLKVEPSPRVRERIAEALRRALGV